MKVEGNKYRNHKILVHNLSLNLEMQLEQYRRRRSSGVYLHSSMCAVSITVKNLILTEISDWKEY